MSLTAIARHYGGTTSHGGTRAMIPGPGHGAADRSISLRLTQDGRVLVTSFGRSHFGEVKDMLRADGFVGGSGHLTGFEPRNEAPPSAGAQGSSCGHLVEPLWRGAISVEQTLSETYITRHRAIRRPLAAIGALKHAYDVPVALLKPHARLKTPALLAGISNAERRLIGLEITHLRADGDRHRPEDIFLPRKTIGPLRQPHQVELDDLADEMVVGEGVFTVLSASQRFDLPGWALLSLSNMRRWAPPAGIRRLIIARDNGRAALQIASELAERARAQGVQVCIRAPKAAFSDFNDEDRGRPMPAAKGKGRASAGVQQKGTRDEHDLRRPPAIFT